MTSSISPAIQKITASGGSSITDVEMRIDATSPQKIYFNLELVPDGDDDPFASLVNEPTNETPIFEPGRTYQIRVWLGVNAQPGQQGVYIRSGMDLFLWAHNTPGINISNPRSHIGHEEIHNYFHDFNIIVGEEIPMGDLILELCYVDSEVRHKPLPAATLRVSLVGQHNPVDEDLLEQCHVVLDIKPPDNVAILHIWTLDNDNQTQ